MKDLVTPVAVDEIRNVVRKCLENAALINYTKVNEMAKNEGKMMRTLALHRQAVIERLQTLNVMLVTGGCLQTYAWDKTREYKQDS